VKSLVVKAKGLKSAGRWDIDFHLPPIGIKAFPRELLVSIDKCADIVKTKRDPTKKPDVSFQYVDIASIDVEIGVIARPQELTGSEAPSRARKVIHGYDIIVSTVRPTRGASAVVPEELHGQICSTGFSVIRCKPGVNPFYLHFALRLQSTLEQFRKWSTGSSYPAILDEDVTKTMIPLPVPETQDRIARVLRTAAAKRESAIQAANQAWKTALDSIVQGLEKNSTIPDNLGETTLVYSIDQVKQRLAGLPPVEEESGITEEESLENYL
jgi:restriction endonuclease S subunit